MLNNSVQKKKEIDGVMSKYQTRMDILKKERDGILSSFLKILHEKRLEELRVVLKIPRTNE